MELLKVAVTTLYIKATKTITYLYLRLLNDVVVVVELLNDVVVELLNDVVVELLNDVVEL